MRKHIYAFAFSTVLDWLAVVDMRLFIDQSLWALPFTAVYTLAWGLVISYVSRDRLPAIAAGAVLGTWLGMMWP